MATYKNSYPFGNTVRDGLVLNLDATNIASYSAGSSIWYDTSGNGNNGTLTNGPTFLQERGRGSIVFDGTNDYVLGSSTFNYTSSTWNCWFNPASLTTAGVYPRRIMHKSDNSGNNELNLLHSNGTVQWYGWGTSTYLWNVSASGITVNNWHNATGTHDGNNAYLYLNGRLASSASYSGSMVSTVPLCIGRVAFTSVAIYTGSVSVAQIYNRALSSDEVLQNYTALKTRFGL